MAEEIKRKITITTKKADGFRIMPAEGALGGITPSQMYQINFYIEAPNIPTDVTHELSEEGKLGAQLTHSQIGGDIVRELQCAVLMTVQQAEALARWIIKTVEQSRTSSPPSGYVM
ncbi:MAG TPA: hypothetical protein VMX35_16625 [Acidobacteriota bacterium]|nr:hypothetical protein [Acidobacteriota bacterium]